MFHTQGVVLKKNFYRDFDEIYTVYTRDFGKIEILGRGVKKPVAKLNSHFQVLDLSDIEFVLGRKYKVLTGADLAANYLDFSENVELKKVALGFLDFADKICELENANKEIWDLFCEFGNFLSEAKDKNFNDSSYFLFLHFFKCRLLSLCGFAPNLESCVICQKKLKEDDFKIDPVLSGGEGGVICADCPKGNKSSFVKILPSTIKIFKIFCKNYDLDKYFLSKIKLSGKEKSDFARAFDYFVEYTVG